MGYRKFSPWLDIYNCSPCFIHEVMEKDGNFILVKDQIEEIKQIIIQRIEKYIDLKLKPIISYFEKKKDFFEMSFL